MEITVAVAVSVLGVTLTVLNIVDRLFSTKDRIRRDGAIDAVTQSDITALRSGNASILVGLDKIDGKIDNHAERITRSEGKIEALETRVEKIENKM